MRIGYFLSCEELGPAELVEQAVAAVEDGKQAALSIDRTLRAATAARAA